jgi:hypothetical protein
VAGRFTLKFTVKFKYFSNLKYVTVNFKDILRIRGGGTGCVPLGPYMKYGRDDSHVEQQFAIFSKTI